MKKRFAMHIIGIKNGYDDRPLEVLFEDYDTRY